jgi:NHLM bacteriocin system ABC transporter peptidase/ATP-binding protein
MVLAYHGRLVPLDELRALCGVARDGAKASSLLRAARTFGLEAKGLKAEPHHLAALAFPLIAFVNFNHFLVVEHVDADHVWLNDPAFGRRRETMAEFSDSFTGVVLTFVKGSEFVRGDTRPRLLASLWARLEPARGALFFVALTSLALVIPGLVLPAFSRIFVDYILIRGIHDWLRPLLIGMALTAVVRFGLLMLRQQMLLNVRSRLRLATGRTLFAKLMTLPIAFFDQRFAGEIADRLRLNEGLVDVMTGQLASVGAALVISVFFLVAMLLYSPPLTLAVVLLAAGNIAALLLTTRTLSERSRKISIDQGKLASARIAGIKDIETFKASGAEDMIFARWLGLTVNVENGRQQIAAVSAWLSVTPGLIGTLTTAVVLIGGGLEVMRGRMTLGELVAYQTLAASFSGPVMQLVGLGQQLQDIRSYTARLDDIMDQAPDPAFVAEPPALDRLPRGGLTIEGLSFGYGPLDPPLIADFSLTLAPGSRVALVGASGSGKSTLGKLIAGLEHPRGGAILIDGRPPLAWPREALAARLAYVRQDISLFEGTVRENLCLWDESLPETDLVAAAQDARIHELIASRPGGYGAAVAEGGGNFSGGERQRLEIARALALNPSIVVLDEATSALDPVTELAVMDAIRRRGATCIVIAHRLSAIRDCDEIIVMDHGAIAERGPHEALLAARGAYAGLVVA